MNHHLETGGEYTSRVVSIPFSNISWGGESPWPHTYCFGTDDGRIMFQWMEGIDGKPEETGYRVADSEESINGVAFQPGFMAVSTRSEVLLYNVPKRNHASKELYGLYEGGAHGISKTPWGGFIAPIGREGILFVDPPCEGAMQGTFKTISLPGKDFNSYRLTPLSSVSEDKSSFLVSGRKSGLLVMSMSRLENVARAKTLRFPGLDVVDACSLGSKELPHAAVAVSKDCSLHFGRDVLADPLVLGLHMDGLRGIAYKIISTNGNIFVLTSEGLYVFRGLASRLVREERISGPTPAFALELRAVDAFLAYDQFLIIMPDEVLSADMRDIAGEGHEDGARMPWPELSFQSSWVENDWEMETCVFLDENMKIY